MELAKYIEHTLLKPACNSQVITQLCDEAKQYGFAGVCIPPFFVRHATSQLEGSGVRVATVIGFPMGYSTIPAKVEEVKRAVDEGVDELDMVANICAIKDNKWAYVQNDLDAVIRAAHLHGKTLKVIIEAGLLTNDEIKKICDVAMEVGADYIKTSTGFNTDPTTPDMIRRIKGYINPATKIKASGGIRTREQAEQLIQAGAHRIGTSSSLQIIGATPKK